MQKYNALMESKNELERIHKERIENMKTNFESEKSELEAHNLQRFNIEVERY